MNNTTHKNRQEILNKADKAFLVGVADDVADKCSFCGKCCVFDQVKTKFMVRFVGVVGLDYI